MEESKPENNVVIHIPIVQGVSMKPAMVDDQLCPMYSGNWVVFQPDYIIDARLGCLWQVRLLPAGLAHQVGFVTTCNDLLSCRPRIRLPTGTIGEFIISEFPV
ncbi:jg22273 [Pararge aegeria aegeria]|uniref:Jg22273 protein n=1 Tax=Pararge aegeria aegeria TaxID=348720 RepID=A0A8S4QJN9_9NEOP|nr:jg22273 [Pararge aegeria aegeria]